MSARSAGEVFFYERRVNSNCYLNMEELLDPIIVKLSENDLFLNKTMPHDHFTKSMTSLTSVKIIIPVIRCVCN